MFITLKNAYNPVYKYMIFIDFPTLMNSKYFRRELHADQQ